MNRNKRILIRKTIVNKGFVKNGGAIYTMKCLNCGNKFDIKGGEYNAGRGYFCSPKCRDEYTAKNGLVKGKNNPIYGLKGKNNPRYGTKHSEKTKEKIRKKAIGRKIPKEVRMKMGRKGKENKNWKGGTKIVRQNWRDRHKNEISYRLDNSVSSMIYHALKENKAGRKWETLVGYTIKDLMNHLEKQFDEKMNWSNYGSYWHIDHIKPRSLFKYKHPEEKEFQECWSLRNLRPLEKIANIKKSNNYHLI